MYKFHNWRRKQFAPDAGGSAGGADAAQATQATAAPASAQGAAGGEAQAAQTTFTLEEVTRLIQSEADKRVTQALKRQQAEYERQAKLSGLTDSERTLAEKDAAIESLTAQLSELNAYKAKNAVLQALSDAQLPASFAELITIDSDPENAELNVRRVQALSDAFRRAVEEGVKQRLSGRAAAPGAGTGAPAMTREQFLRLSLDQQQTLARTDPELYRQLTR